MRTLAAAADCGEAGDRGWLPDGPVRLYQHGTALVAAADQLEEQMRRIRFLEQIAEFVDDQGRLRPEMKSRTLPSNRRRNGSQVSLSFLGVIHSEPRRVEFLRSRGPSRLRRSIPNELAAVLTGLCGLAPDAIVAASDATLRPTNTFQGAGTGISVAKRFEAFNVVGPGTIAPPPEALPPWAASLRGRSWRVGLG